MMGTEILPLTADDAGFVRLMRRTDPGQVTDTVTTVVHTPEPIVYSVGKNMIGYMPESSTYFTLDHASAKNTIIYDLDIAGDNYADVGENGLADECSSEMEDANLISDGEEFDAFIGDMHFWLAAHPASYYGFDPSADIEEQIDAANDECW